jgi:DNA mismatch endonuclease (patch repair protein)
MDNLTREQRRKNMQNIRSKGTKTELIVARELKKRKIYFTQHPNDVLGKPDILLRRKKIAVFIDSDFWHGNPKRFIMPKTNTDYWGKKIADNKKRDCDTYIEGGRMEGNQDMGA